MGSTKTATASTSWFGSLVNTASEVASFWQSKVQSWWYAKPPKQTLLEALGDARQFEEWEAIAFQLDEILGNDLWRQNPTSKYYDYRLIYERLQAINEAREDEDILGLVNLLRSGLVRNLGNITAPRLFNRAFAGTKLLIDEYITQVALAVEHVTAYPTEANYETGLTSQAKLDLLHDTRQAFGRTALVLQGGAIFGLCHIGVVKALHLHGLLPRIIVGSATGALIAALVGIHKEDELLRFLNGDTVDLSAFVPRGKRKRGDIADDFGFPGRAYRFARRFAKFIREGALLDPQALEDFIRTNVGDITFEEAYARTKRVLNITLPVENEGGLPSLLNYLTAPNVLVWSAAIASNTLRPTSSGTHVTLLCKDSSGHFYPWSLVTSPALSPVSYSTPTLVKPAAEGTRPAQTMPQSHQRLQSHTPLIPSKIDSNSPLPRVTSLFNVNHFLISSARPSLFPLLLSGDALSQSTPRPSTTRQKGWFWLPMLRVMVLELQHRVRQLDALGMLHGSFRKFVVDEMAVPTMAGAPGTVGGAAGMSMMLVPEVGLTDLTRLIEGRGAAQVREWVLKGERSVWPAVAALKVRCAIEVELDRGYQFVRRRKPLETVAVDGDTPGAVADSAKSSGHSSGQHLKGMGEKRKRLRSSSYGDR